MNRTGRVLGTVLVIFGIIFLLKNFNIFTPLWSILNLKFIVKNFWASLFVILPGLLFHMGYFSGNRRDPGMLVPGGILMVSGIALQLGALFGIFDVVWPLFIFSVAFGLFELYIFGTREKGLLIPIGILSGLSAAFFVLFSLNSLLGPGTRRYVIPVILIGLGALILLKGKRNNSR